MLGLTMLPARDGDCLVLAYGTGAGRRLLIDGGRAPTAEAVFRHLDALAKDARALEALVVTHIDADHITGALKLTGDRRLPAIGDVWFNAYHHLVETAEPSAYESFSAAQGERLSDAIVARGLPWNRAFGGNAVRVQGEGATRSVMLADGLRITLLSPDPGRLARLAPSWRLELFKAGLDRSQPDLPEPAIAGFERFGEDTLDVGALAAREDRPDRSAANGSSIAFVAEWNGRRILLAADAHPALLEAAIAPLAAAEEGRYRIDLFKVAHHGSAANVTRPLLALLDCGHFAFSTDGSKHGHPDPETIAKILTHCSPGRPKVLHFNYRQPMTSVWDDEGLMRAHAYRCVFPEPGNEGSLAIPVP